jgi:hypothetical protein
LHHVKRKILFIVMTPPVFYIASSVIRSIFSFNNQFFSQNHFLLIPFTFLNEFAGLIVHFFNNNVVSLILTLLLYGAVVYTGYIIRLKLRNNSSILKIFKRK